MYIPNIAKSIKKMSVNEINASIFENYYKRIKTLEKRFFVASKQINRKKYLILTILKNTFYYL